MDKNPFTEVRSLNSTYNPNPKFEQSRGNGHSRVTSNYQEQPCQNCSQIKFNFEEKFKFMKSQNFELQQKLDDLN